MVARVPLITTLVSVQVDKDSPVPFYMQLRNWLLAEIEAGRITSRLPSARTLEQQTGLSHDTTEHALRQLAEEGIAVAVRGKGYYVTRQDQG
jgi:DNA-binding GntR family transcriptional regulator